MRYVLAAVALTACVARPAQAQMGCGGKWEQAARSDTRAEYQAFIKLCPGHARRADAEAAIKRIAEAARSKANAAAAARREEAERLVRQRRDLELQQACDRAWQTASTSKTSASYNNFLASCPNDYRVADARTAVRRIEADARIKAELAYWGLTPQDLNQLDAEKLMQKANFKNRLSEQAARRAAGDSMLYLLVGLSWQGFQGFTVNYENSRANLVKSAALDNYRAMNALGLLYDRGHGVAKDSNMAADWFRKSAQGGSAFGAANLGDFYYSGLGGITKDAKMAAYWRGFAAHLGQPYAMANFGQQLFDGDGIEKNVNFAAGWFRAAAQAGDALGMSWYGYVLEKGIGVAASPVDAASWYGNAAKAGNAFAMYSYGAALDGGRGIKQDQVAASAWYRKAIAADPSGIGKNAQKALDALLAKRPDLKR